MKTRLLYRTTLLLSICVGLSFLIPVQAAEQHIDLDPPDTAGDGDMEHLIVTGEHEETLETKRQAHRNHIKGMALYSSGRFEEALPYLVAASKRGYKDSQARLAHLYLHGLGGLRRSDKLGIIWMGVAASGQTKPIIRRRFDELLDAVPIKHVQTLKAAVEAYVERYGQYEQTVVCEVAPHASTRISKTRCYFEYEQAVMSALEVADMYDLYKDKIIPPDQWSSFQTLDNFRGNIVLPDPNQGSRD